jgi:DNA-binding transcriptional ArsR family regulator
MSNFTPAPSRERRLRTLAGAPTVPLVAPKPGLDLRAKAGDAAALLKALANPARLLLLCQLVDSERNVAELGASTGIAQPSLSQQLGVLRGERIVATRREGKHVLYRIASPAALAVLQTLYGLFCEPQADVPRTRRSSGIAPKRVKKLAA